MEPTNALLSINSIPMLTNKASLAEQLERHQDLADIMFKMLELSKDDQTYIFSPIQREQFSSANKQLLEKYRSAFRIISLIRTNNADDQFSSSLASYVSLKIIHLTNKVILAIPLIISKLKNMLKADNIDIDAESIGTELNEKQRGAVEALVFFYKMIGDYQRYQIEVYFLLIEYLRPYEEAETRIANKSEADAIRNILRSLNVYDNNTIEFIIDAKSKKTLDDDDSALLDLTLFREIITEEIKQAQYNYEESIRIGKTSLLITNHVLLGAILNYTVFLFEIEKREFEAINIAFEYYQKAMENLSVVRNEEDYSKANLILILLKDNIDGWKGEKDSQERKSSKF